MCDFEIAVETNGTIAAPEGLDWICVSPKAGAELVQRSGDELKLVYPQAGADPEEFERSRSGISSCSRWMDPAATPTRSWRCVIASIIRSGD